MRRVALLLLLCLAACQSPFTAGPTPDKAWTGPGTGEMASPSAAPSPRTAVLAPPTPVPTASPTPHVRQLVALGASDVVGFGADDPATDNWASVLATLLPEHPHLTRLGAIGRLASVIRRDALPEAEAVPPDVAVLWTGVNDFNAGVTLDDFKTDLDAIVTGLEGAGAHVYMLNLPDLDRLPAFAANAAAVRQALPAWQAAVSAEGTARHATVIDLASYTNELVAHPEYIAFDGFHPSTAGYRRLAAVVMTALAPQDR